MFEGTQIISSETDKITVQTSPKYQEAYLYEFRRAGEAVLPVTACTPHVLRYLEKQGLTTIDRRISDNQTCLTDFVENHTNPRV